VAAALPTPRLAQAALLKVLVRLAQKMCMKSIGVTTMSVVSLRQIRSTKPLCLYLNPLPHRAGLALCVRYQSRLGWETMTSSYLIRPALCQVAEDLCHRACEHQECH